MAKNRRRYSKKKSAAPQRDWRLITSIIVGAVIVLAGVGLVIGIVVGGASGGTGPDSCRSNEIWCSIVNRCVPANQGCPHA